MRRTAQSHRLYGFLISLYVVVFGVSFLTLPFFKRTIEPLPVPLTDSPVAQKLTVNFKPGTTDEDKKAYLERIGGSVELELKELNSVVVHVDDLYKAEEAKLNEDIIASSENDYYVSALGLSVSNDPRLQDQWALETIGAFDAWAKIGETTNEVKVAVIDSGVCVAHPDLAGKIDLGWDYVENDGNPQDEFGHGCAVSGIIAANINNGIGIAGVSPKARIVPLRVLDASGSGRYSNVAAAIVYAADHDSDIINLSLGGVNESQILKDAINYAVDKGVKVIAASGNTGVEGVLYPAAYDNVIAVGSVDQNLQRSSFSTYGPQVDVLAPGRDILTTNKNGEYSLMSGTSFAAGNFSGILAANINVFDSESVNAQIDLLNSMLAVELGSQNEDQVSTEAGEVQGLAINSIQEISTSANVKALKFDLSDSNLRFEVVTAGDAYNGTRETLQQMVTRKHALGGINTDYFGDAGPAQGTTYINGVRKGDFAATTAVQGNDPYWQDDRNCLRTSLAIGKGGWVTGGYNWANIGWCDNRDTKYMHNVTGAGPQFLKDGNSVWDKSTNNYGKQLINGEYFPVGNYYDGSRGHSSAGISADGRYLILASTTDDSTDGSKTPNEMSEYMKSLGAHNAIKLDGGGSTQLYYNGQYLINSTDRPLAAALLFYYNENPHACEDFSDGNNVVVYQTANCSGANQVYNQTGSRTNYIWPDSFNDSISSLKVRNGWSVRVYKDHSFVSSATSRCITKSMWDLNLDYFTLGQTDLKINDQISSIQVFADSSCGNGDACVLQVGASDSIESLSCEPTTGGGTGSGGSGSSCPSGNGVYCGSSVGLNANVLYQCTNGNYAALQSCSAGCHVNAPGTPDVCNATSGGGTGSCPSGNGRYCGGTLGLDQNTLYDCANGVSTPVQSCSYGCFYNTPGNPDFCRPSSTSSCPSGNGDYCGSSLGLNPNTLYTCTNGNSVVKEQCSNGCQQNPPGTADVCNIGGSSSSRVELFGDSDYGNLRMSTSVSTNEPSKNTLYKSMRLPSGWSVKLYDQDNYSGGSDCFSQSESNLESRGWHNRVESIQVFTTNACPQPQGSRIKICRITGWWSDHTGECMDVSYDIPSLNNAGFGNDTLKAINFEGSWEAILYEDDNYGGRYFRTTSNNEDLGGIPFGYGTSSIKVRRTDQTKISLFDGGDQSGDRFNSDRSNINLDHWNFNDRAGSVHVDSGYEVVLCTNSHFKGICGRTKVSMNNLNSITPGLQDQVSSFQLCQGECPPVPTLPNITSPFRDESFVPGAAVAFNWTGDAVEYVAEISGGTLSLAVSSGWSNATTWTRSDLQPSIYPYYLRVKGWNPYGEGEWSTLKSFYVQDIPISQVMIDAPVSAELSHDVSIQAFINPVDATNVTYNWVPEPVSGQGTKTAVFNLTTVGQQAITLTASNTSGSVVQTTSTINVGCSDKYLVEYYNNENLAGEPVAYECKDSIDEDWNTGGPESISSAAFNVGNGADGDLFVDAGQEFFVDTVRTRIADNPASGQNKVCVFNLTGFNVGDEVLVVQSHGANAGTHEFGRIASKDESCMYLATNLMNSYVPEHGQVLRVPNYRNVVVKGTLTSSTWDTYTGGVVAFRASNSVTLQESGKITASGKGFRGGERSWGRSITGHQGEGWNGGLGINTRMATDYGGGGGGHGTGDGGGNGGGGSYRSAGGNSNDPWFGDIAYGSTNIYGDAQITKLFFGGGGGAGGTDDSGYDYTTAGGYGGTGGGVVLIETNKIEGLGVITADGQVGENRWANEHGGGGGGAGGSVKLLADKVDYTNVYVGASGNIGGQGKDGRGGTGGEGQFFRKYCTNLGSVPLSGSGEQVTNCEKDHFSVRWSKTQVFEAGRYQFTDQADDGVKVWVDDTLVIDQWANGYHETSGEIDLSAGEHTIKMDYYDHDGNASANLSVTQISAGCEANTFSADYFANTTFSGDPAYSTCESAITHDWGGFGPGNGVPNDNFSARWTGDFDFTAGSYKFTEGSDDGMRVWVDDVLILDDWEAHGYRERDNTIALTQGAHSIKAEFREDGGGAVASLRWETTTPVEPPPTPSDCDNQFCVDYFNNLSLSGTATYATTETDIHHEWGSFGPGNGVGNDNFSGRWLGNFTFDAGDYRFLTYTDDGVRMWVDDTQVINNWTDHGTTLDEGTITLTQGQHTLKLEYYEKDGGAVLHMGWEYLGSTNPPPEPPPSSMQTPLVRLDFDENNGTSIANTGSLGGNLVKTSPPAWSSNVPGDAGGTSSMNFGTTTGNYVVESGSTLSGLAGLSKFTLTGWVNNVDSTEGSGGNRIISWINHGGDGVDLVYKSDGSLQVGIDQWPDNLPSRSNAGKITTSPTASNDNWKFFAVTYDSTLGSEHLKFYFGSQSAAAAFDKAVDYNRGAVGTGINKLAVGHFNSATRSIALDRMFRGLIDELKVFDTALTLSEINDVQGDVSTQPPPTTSYTYKFRFYPRSGNQIFSDRMAGGKFQGSNTSGTTALVDLATITSAPAQNQWGELTVTSAETYRYLRYLSPNDGYGNVAEVEFYLDDVKLGGTHFGSSGSWENAGDTYDKVFDGNIATFFDGATGNGQYMGYDTQTAPPPPPPSGCTNTFCVDYYSGTALAGSPIYSTTETTVNHVWNEFGPGNGVPVDNFSGRWTGDFSFNAGTYRFTTYSDDGIRLWVDDNLVINNWTDHGMIADTADVTLSAGSHNVKIEYYEAGGGAIMTYSVQQL